MKQFSKMNVLMKETPEELKIERYFTKAGVHPFDEIEWEFRDATISDSKGKIIFEQKNVEIPKTWSQSATKIVVSKYFRGKLCTPARETSVKQMISRVSKTIGEWGKKGGYFLNEEEAKTFEDELTHILVNQMAAFNSPVWFNLGIEEKPQSSACFINSVKDDMRSILTLAVTEGMLFKGGSGTGSNLSCLRSSKEYLAGGGKASGPVSFMKGFDAFAGVIKSGGKTRRAAKMVILDVDHPDIMDFINCKVREEKKAHALIDAGFDPSIDGDVYSNIFFQNANNSVRVTDEFMKAVIEDKTFSTRYVTNKEPCETFKARELMKAMAAAAHACGDPGLQYDTIINKWHTCPNTSRINASNPCSEYMFLDDSACNLASLNLMKFRKDSGDFDTERFKRAVEIMIMAQEILVSYSSYPTEMIEKNSHEFRPLGMGYANIGALLMSCGMAYDSDEARNFAAAITALMSGHAYKTSSLVSQRIGPFDGYKTNEEPFLNVIDMHRNASYKIESAGVPEELLKAARKSWDEAAINGLMYGFRNAQISVLAPTGTIGFLMDCDTTGVEPEIALVKYKWLVGGGMMKLVNATVPQALRRLGYSEQQMQDILSYINEKDTIEGAPGLKDEHLPIFDCSFKANNGKRSIHYLGHLKMMSAVQPFISGAISKTINMPTEASEEEVMEAYIQGWKLGLKAVAIYRDGSKRTQPLTTTKDMTSTGKNANNQQVQMPAAGIRMKLPNERNSITHKFAIGNHEGYLTVGMYEDGSPGEIFIVMSKEGTAISGLMDSFSTSISLALQYGVPLKVLANKFLHTRFEPSGVTTNENIRFAKSIVDYIFKWMSYKFLSNEDQEALGLDTQISDNFSRPFAIQQMQKQPQIEAKPQLQQNQPGSTSATNTPAAQTNIQLQSNATSAMDKAVSTFKNPVDSPMCGYCGSIMVRNAACYKCTNCGGTSGCS